VYQPACCLPCLVDRKEGDGHADGYCRGGANRAVYRDRAGRARDVDLTRPLPPDLVIAAAQADPEMINAIGPYLAMLAPPASLDAVQARARDIYASGWRPPIPPGPTREELAELVTAAASSHGGRRDTAA
jgi:hypothetical protein